MANDIVLPHVRGFDFGIGIDRLSGSLRNLVVDPTPSPPKAAGGSIASYDISRVRSSRELQSSLGINIEASYGCAAFGAGASARFSYMEEEQVHSSSLFMTIVATFRAADLSIDHSVLTPQSSEIGRPDVFQQRYGDVFCRACTRGGIFVGVLRVETVDSSEANSIEAEISGSYGLFSAEAELKFKRVFTQSENRFYYSLYKEGGPSLQIEHPEDPTELLRHVNTWMDGISQDPDRYSVPYEWTLSPITIAEGPEPPNAADIQGAQDVLQTCANDRVDLLDNLGQANWFIRHQEAYDWANTSVTLDDISAAARGFQRDLDLLKKCASRAMNNPKDATYPAVYGETLSPPHKYRSVLMPSPLPKVKPRDGIHVVDLTGQRVSTVFYIQKWSGLDLSYEDFKSLIVNTYEDYPGTVAIIPSLEVYKFIRSGVLLDGVPDDEGSIWSSWVMKQEPASGWVSPDGGSVRLTVERSGDAYPGYPPRELWPYWGLS